MRKPFRAQSTLEFIMIIILVLAGVIVMGPYVIRSVNAYLRSWEVSSEQARNQPADIDPYTPVLSGDFCEIFGCTTVYNFACTGPNSEVCDYTGLFNDKKMLREIAVSQYCTGNMIPNDPDTVEFCDDRHACWNKCEAVGSGCCTGKPDGSCSPPTSMATCPQAPDGETHTSCPADCWCGNNKCDWYESTDPTSPDYCAADCAAATCTGGCLKPDYTTCTSEKQSDGKSCCVWVKKYGCEGGSCKKKTSGTCVTREVARTNQYQCKNSNCSWWAPYGAPANPYDTTCCNYCSCYSSGTWTCPAAGCSAGPY